MEPKATAHRHPEPAFSFAVFEPTAGQIVQIHHFGAMPGAALPAIEELRQIALRHAAAGYKRAEASLQAIEIDARAIKPKTSYRVSLPDRRLVEDPGESKLERG